MVGGEQRGGELAVALDAAAVDHHAWLREHLAGRRGPVARSLAPPPLVVDLVHGARPARRSPVPRHSPRVVVELASRRLAAASLSGAPHGGESAISVSWYEAQNAAYVNRMAHGRVRPRLTADDLAELEHRASARSAWRAVGRAGRSRPAGPEDGHDAGAHKGWDPG